MPDIHSRIRSLRARESLTREAFGQRIGVSAAKLQALETGRQRVDHGTIQEIAKNFDIDLHWLLLGGDNNKIAPAEVTNSHQSGGELHRSGFEEAAQVDAYAPASTGEADFVSVPRYDVQVSAGAGADVDGEYLVGHYAFSRNWLTKRNLSAGALAVVQVSGDSMEPILTDGDLAVVNTAETEMKDGVTYVFRLGNDLLVKRLQILPLQHVNLCSINPGYAPILIELGKQELVVVGRVVSSMHEW